MSEGGVPASSRQFIGTVLLLATSLVMCSNAQGQNATLVPSGEVTTTVVNEVDDLLASKGKPVELLASGKDIDVTLQNGRRIKAHRVAANKCAQN
jgi:hypothetical protein